MVIEVERKPKIKIINGKKYAYDLKSYWDKEQKKYRKISVYLGRVTDDENALIWPAYMHSRSQINRIDGSNSLPNHGILPYRNQTVFSLSEIRAQPCS